jgi:aminoglycoside 3-N-acetyltransferase
MSFWTKRRLRDDVEAMGVTSGDTLMIHAALRSVGKILGGPDALIAAILDVLGAQGALLVYTDWDDGYHELLDSEGRVPAQLRADIPPFNPATSRARRANGSIAELVRTWPGAIRSRNPGASCAAVGKRADWLTADHAYDYGYGEQSPFARLVEARGKVLMIGAPLATMTLLHHAEHLARMPGKRLQHYDMPLLIKGGTQWRRIEEFDTSDPVVDGLEATYFSDIVVEFLRTGRGVRGTVGQATSVQVPAASVVAFAVKWLEDRAAAKSAS